MSNGRLAAAPGVVDDDGHATERVHRGLHDGFALVLRGDVAGERGGPSAGRADGRGDLVRRRGVEVADEHRRAGLSQAFRYGATNARAGAGDDGDLAGEVEQRVDGHGGLLSHLPVPRKWQTYRQVFSPNDRWLAGSDGLPPMRWQYTQVAKAPETGCVTSGACSAATPAAGGC